MKKPLVILSVAAALIIGGGALYSAVTYTYNDDIKSILSANNCTGCHTYMAAYSDLITKKSVTPATSGIALVNAAKPDSSVIVWRLEGQLPDGSSAPLMPQGGDKLPDSTIQKVRDWISQGAPEETVAVEPSSWGRVKGLFR